MLFHPFGFYFIVLFDCIVHVVTLASVSHQEVKSRFNSAELGAKY